MSGRNTPDPRPAGAGSVVAPTIRAMAEADIDQVHRIETAGSPDPWSRSLLADELVGDRGDRCWLVASLDGEIIGFGGLLFITDEAHIMNMGVTDRHRRRGVARAVLAKLLLTAGDRGATAATLEVRASNQPAIRLYEGFGFTIAGHRPAYYPDGENATIMWAHGIYKQSYRDRLDAIGSGPWA